MKLTIKAVLTNPKPNRWRALTMLGSLTIAGYGGSEQTAISQLRALVGRQAKYLAAEGYLEDLTSRHQIAFERGQLPLVGHGAPGSYAHPTPYR